MNNETHLCLKSRIIDFYIILIYAIVLWGIIIESTSINKLVYLLIPFFLVLYLLSVRSVTHSFKLDNLKLIVFSHFKQKQRSIYYSEIKRIRIYLKHTTAIRTRVEFDLKNGIVLKFTFHRIKEELFIKMKQYLTELDIEVLIKK